VRKTPHCITAISEITSKFGSGERFGYYHRYALATKRAFLDRQRSMRARSDPCRDGAQPDRHYAECAVNMKNASGLSSRLTCPSLSGSI
jgi:hypothetical protein